MRKLLLFLLLGVNMLAYAQLTPCNVGIASTPATCYGGSNGTASVTLPTGGSYTYTWSPPISSNSQSVSGLSAGTYTVAVVGAGSGTGPLATFYTETFDNNPAWTLNTVTGLNDANANMWYISDDEGGQLPPNCGIANNGNATLHVTASPGTGAAYNAGGLCGIGVCVVTNKRAESQSISSVGYTNLNLKFNYIGNGEALDDNCSLVYSIDNGVTWTTLNPSLKSAVCPPPSSQGQWTAYNVALPATCAGITTLRIGFVWTNDDDGVGTDPSFAVDNISIEGNQIAGACVSTLTATVTQPTQIISSGAITGGGCGATADIALSVSGGTPSYTFQWTNGAITQNLTGVTPGPYVCIITDAVNCIDTITVTVPNGGNSPVLTLAPQPANCGTSNGSVAATISGGTAPFTYSWFPSGNNAPTITGVPAGIYTCTITDNTGCTAVQSTTVNSLSSILVSVNYTNPTCAEEQNGSITVNPVGGTAPYTYSWTNGNSTPTIMNIGAGTYSCYIVDVNGCSVLSQTSLTAGPAITLNASTGAGTATVVASGGNPPYSYSWNTTPVQTTQTATGLAIGSYQVFVTDANGCVRTTSVTILTSDIDYQTIGLNLLQVYPNPANSSLIVTLEPNQVEDITISLLDVTQREVARQNFNQTSNVNTQLEVQSLTEGVYFLNIQTAKGKIVEKIVVSH